MPASDLFSNVKNPYGVVQSVQVKPSSGYQPVASYSSDLLAKQKVATEALYGKGGGGGGVSPAYSGAPSPQPNEPVVPQIDLNKLEVASYSPELKEAQSKPKLALFGKSDNKSLPSFQVNYPQEQQSRQKALIESQSTALQMQAIASINKSKLESEGNILRVQGINLNVSSPEEVGSFNEKVGAFNLSVEQFNVSPSIVYLNERNKQVEELKGIALKAREPQPKLISPSAWFPETSSDLKPFFEVQSNDLSSKVYSAPLGSLPSQALGGLEAIVPFGRKESNGSFVGYEFKGDEYFFVQATKGWLDFGIPAIERHGLEWLETSGSKKREIVRGLVSSVVVSQVPEFVKSPLKYSENVFSSFVLMDVAVKSPVLFGERVLSVGAKEIPVSKLFPEGYLARVNKEVIFPYGSWESGGVASKDLPAFYLEKFRSQEFVPVEFAGKNVAYHATDVKISSPVGEGAFPSKATGLHLAPYPSLHFTRITGAGESSLSFLPDVPTPKVYVNELIGGSPEEAFVRLPSFIKSEQEGLNFLRGNAVAGKAYISPAVEFTFKREGEAVVAPKSEFKQVGLDTLGSKIRGYKYFFRFNDRIIPLPEIQYTGEKVIGENVVGKGLISEKQIKVNAGELGKLVEEPYGKPSKVSTISFVRGNVSSGGVSKSFVSSNFVEKVSSFAPSSGSPKVSSNISASRAIKSYFSISRFAPSSSKIPSSSLPIKGSSILPSKPSKPIPSKYSPSKYFPVPSPSYVPKKTFIPKALLSKQVSISNKFPKSKLKWEQKIIKGVPRFVPLKSNPLRKFLYNERDLPLTKKFQKAFEKTVGAQGAFYTFPTAEEYYKKTKKR